MRQHVGQAGRAQQQQQQQQHTSETAGSFGTAGSSGRSAGLRLPVPPVPASSTESRGRRGGGSPSPELPEAARPPPGSCFWNDLRCALTATLISPLKETLHVVCSATGSLLPLPHPPNFDLISPEMHLATSCSIQTGFTLPM